MDKPQKEGLKMYNGDDINTLKGMRNISEYIDALSNFKKEFLIILSTKDTPGHHVTEDAFQKIRGLGFTNMTKNFQYMYIGVIFGGEIIYDKCGETAEEALLFEGDVKNCTVSVKSSAGAEGISEIKINGNDYSMNGRGWNIVIYDYHNNRVFDSVTYDSYSEYPEFYHKNFYFDDDFFESHFFIPDKYKRLWTEPFTKSCYSSRVLGVREIENGIILPLKGSRAALKGGICDENFNFISGHDILRKKKGRYIWGSYKVPDNELDYIDETVVYGEIMFDHPGHLLAEYFANRTWWFVKNPGSKLKIAVQNFDGDGTAKFSKEFLYRFGFSEEQIIFVEKPTKFKKIIVPEQSVLLLEWSNPSYEYTEEFVSALKHLARDVEPSEYKKIYFTKSGIRGNIVGEKYFADFYADKGFKIIDPADYTLKEKISFMLGCDEFVTLIGTSALYSVFCKPTVKLTILSRINTNGFTHICSICEAACIKDIYCVDISMNFLHKNFVYGISLLGVTDSFKKYVKSVYGEELSISTEESIKNNLWEYLSYFPEYYSNSQSKWGGVNQFNNIKNQKMLTVLQMMSEVFLGKEFETAGLDLTTAEDELRCKCKINAVNTDFMKRLFHDVLFDNKLANYIKVNNYTSVSLICTDPDVSQFIQDVLRLFYIDMICCSSKSTLHDIPDAEWKKCKAAKVVLYYDPRNRNAGLRDGINAVNIQEILKGSNRLISTPLFNVETLSVLKERSSKSEEILNTVKRSEQEKKKSDTEIIESLNCINSENKKLSKEIIEAFNEFKFKSEKANTEVIESLKELKRENEKTNKKAMEALKEIESAKKAANKEILALKSKIDYYENSRSWRITKPLRAITKALRRLLGKKNRKGGLKQ